MYVCMYVCMYVHTYVRMNTHYMLCAVLIYCIVYIPYFIQSAIDREPVFVGSCSNRPRVLTGDAARTRSRGECYCSTPYGGRQRYRCARIIVKYLTHHYFASSLMIVSDPSRPHIQYLSRPQNCAE
jgi:hypothetical protein